MQKWLGFRDILNKINNIQYLEYKNGFFISRTIIC